MNFILDIQDFVINYCFQFLTSIFFCVFQYNYYRSTRKNIELYGGIFQGRRRESFATHKNDDKVIQIDDIDSSESDLNDLIGEINKYIVKTKGTTDFAIIQNKVEDKLDMRYEQAVAKISFPTYLGLMGTFAGVFIGILMFIYGFDGADGVTDDSIRKLLSGVLVSMLTSFVGLLFTTRNSSLLADEKKKVESAKIGFFDFIQTELMPQLDVSLVAAISRLHRTVNEFAPAFNGVISKFQETFDRCTTAFGQNFEQNVKAISSAVKVMGENMNRINENIRLQEQLLSTLKSDKVREGLDKYVEAANGFSAVTSSLDKFEKAREMMLDAANESIKIQNAYSESLQIPNQVAEKINQILDRVWKFENSVNRLGEKLDQREILGNDVVNKIRDQINSIAKKDRTAERYLEIADADLEQLFKDQTQLINEMNQHYRNALSSHIDGFEDMLKAQTDELGKRHKEFLDAIDKKLSISDVRNEFSNLSKLDDILKVLNLIAQDPVRANSLLKALGTMQHTLDSKLVAVNRNGTGNSSSQYQTETSGGTGNPYAKGERMYHPGSQTVNNKETERTTVEEDDDEPSGGILSRIFGFGRRHERK
jgi:hypothetical protein